jgi:hypothetical protein
MVLLVAAALFTVDELLQAKNASEQNAATAERNLCIVIDLG